MKKTASHLIAGLDIGTQAVRLAVGQFGLRADGREGLQILGAAEAPAEGVNRGVINSIEDAVSAVSSCLERAERMVGVPIDRAWVGISGGQILSQASKGVVAVSTANSEILEDDVARVLEAARMIATPLNYEVLHVLPKSFSVDGQNGIKDPVGMTGIRLEADAHVILGSSAQIKNLTKVVYRAGLEIEDVVLSALAVADAVLLPKQKELGVAVINIGASTVSLAVYEEGDLILLSVIPIGAAHITNDLAIGLRTGVDIAERVKIEYGDCSPARTLGGGRTEIDLQTLGGAERELIKRQYVNEIIEARVEEIFRRVDEELARIGRSGLLPAGAVLTGGGAKLPGLVEAAKKYLRLPAVLGYPFDLDSISDKVNDLSYSAAIGLVKWGAVMHKTSFTPHQQLDKMRAIGGVLRTWFKNLVP